MDDPCNSTAPLPSEPPSEINGETNGDTEVPMEIVKDDKTSPARLAIQNIDDGNEETVLMTIEEAQNYILSKVESYIRDPAVNPLLVLKKKIQTLREESVIKNEEFLKMNKMFEALFRDQLKFLIHIGVVPAPDTKTVGVSVDLPWIAESVPSLMNDNLLKSNSADKVGVQPINGAVPVLSKKEASEPIECIDLTEDGEAPGPSVPKPDSVDHKNIIVSNSSTSSTVPAQKTPVTKESASQHPAPLPPVAHGPETPPKPRLKISVDKNGIVLQWDMPPESNTQKITGFEIVGYQEKNNVPVSSALWKKIGCVDLMNLPMSCTLTQFVEGYKYHFSIRALCKDNKFGHYSDPACITFGKKNLVPNKN